MEEKMPSDDDGDQMMGFKPIRILQTARRAEVWRPMLWDKQISGDALRLWLIIEQRSTNKGVTWVSVNCLAIDMGCSPRTIRRLLSSLKERGLLESESRYGKTTLWSVLDPVDLYGKDAIHMILPVYERKRVRPDIKTEQSNEHGRVKVDTPAKSVMGTPAKSVMGTPAKIGLQKSTKKGRDLEGKTPASHVAPSPAVDGACVPSYGPGEYPAADEGYDPGTGSIPIADSGDLPALTNVSESRRERGSGLCGGEDPKPKRSIRGKAVYDERKMISEWGPYDIAGYFCWRFVKRWPGSERPDFTAKEIATIKHRIGWLLHENQGVETLKRFVDYVFDEWDTLRGRMKGWQGDRPDFRVFVWRGVFEHIVAEMRHGPAKAAGMRLDQTYNQEEADQHLDLNSLTLDDIREMRRKKTGGAK